MTVESGVLYRSQTSSTGCNLSPTVACKMSTNEPIFSAEREEKALEGRRPDRGVTASSSFVPYTGRVIRNIFLGQKLRLAVTGTFL